jgi:hypothetical protein
MADTRARIWAGAVAPSDPPNKPLDTDACFWFDSVNEVWKKLSTRIPVDTWTTVAEGSPGGGPIAISDVTNLQTTLDAKAAKASNLSDLANAATSFANIKQAATTTATGVVELATSGENAANVVVQGNDARLSDARTPTAHGNEVHTSTFITQAAITTHEAAADPHTGYQRESEKAAASGYASLDGSTKVPIAQIPTGTSSTTVALGDHTHVNDHARQHSVTAAADHTFPGGTTTFLRADGTFASPTASVAATRTLSTLAFPAKHEHLVTVTDASVSSTSKILAWASGLGAGTTGTADGVDLLNIDPVAGTGSFNLRFNFLTPFAGTLSVDYLVIN